MFRESPIVYNQYNQSFRRCLAFHMEGFLTSLFLRQKIRHSLSSKQYQLCEDITILLVVLALSNHCPYTAPFWCKATLCMVKIARRTRRGKGGQVLASQLKHTRTTSELKNTLDTHLNHYLNIIRIHFKNPIYHPKVLSKLPHIVIHSHTQSYKVKPRHV